MLVNILLIFQCKKVLSRKDSITCISTVIGVGSEGSLGVVTKVSILTPPKLSSVNVAFLACKDYLSCQV